MNSETIQAVENRISYLEDNGNRYKRFGNLGEYEKHQEEIKKLKADLEKMKNL